MAEVVQWPLGTVNVRVRWSEALAVPEAHVMCVVRTIAAIASDDHLRGIAGEDVDGPDRKE